MAILGAHQSIAGGYYKAIERGAAVGCDCVQLFSKNNNQWRAKPISDSEAAQFSDALKRHRIEHTLVHDSYLINLASPDRELWRQSVDAFVVELHRAEQMGIPYVVTHPGAYTASTPEAGLRRVVEALDEIDHQTRSLRVGCLLETTAGQGTALGWRFEELAEMLHCAASPERLGICFDTCHVFAAGYSMRTQKQYATTMREFNRLVGVKQIKAFHLNDSARPRGSRVDRHAHIGEGRLGISAFRWILNDRRFRRVPMYLETPKGRCDGEDLDAINLATLRRLAGEKP